VFKGTETRKGLNPLQDGCGFCQSRLQLSGEEHCFAVLFCEISEIMAMEHVRDHVYGIQWHPEAASAIRCHQGHHYDLTMFYGRNSSSSDEADNGAFMPFPCLIIRSFVL
jgi:hypothetical protein